NLHHGNSAAVHVKIINNTILSGDTAAVKLTDQIQRLDLRALVANNILGRVHPSGCVNGRYDSNLLQGDAACAATGRVGSADLDGAGMLTRNSTLAIDHACSLAPPQDMRGWYRVGRPDLGAFEFGAVAPAGAQRAIVPPGVDSVASAAQ